jgi:hypothetical protein
MPTREQIDNGAHYYDVEAAKAHYAAKEHRELGSPLAAEWEAKAAEHERIAKSLRSLASGSWTPIC